MFTILTSTRFNSFKLNLAHCTVLCTHHHGYMPPCAVSASSVQVRSMRPCCDFTADNRQANGSGELEHSTFRPPSECGWQRGPSAHATALPPSLFALPSRGRCAPEVGKALARRPRETLSRSPWIWSATGGTNGTYCRDTLRGKSSEARTTQP